MDICDSCIEIAERDAGWHTRERPSWRVQCLDCGAWWEHKWIKTIRFYRDRRTQQWTRQRWSELQRYRPISCAQRKCQEHAKHKIAKTGKRKYKCDRHAGVCIIA